MSNEALGGVVLSVFVGAIAFVIAIFILRAVFSIKKIFTLLETISAKLGPDDMSKIIINKPL